jgi:hypothetical protein
MQCDNGSPILLALSNAHRTCLPCQAEAIPDSSSESLQVLVATELLLLLLDAYACKQGTD